MKIRIQHKIAALCLGGLAASTPLAQADIIITEVNSNSNGGDFFELHNTGASSVDLTGWKWDDDSLTPASGGTFGSVSIPAGGVLVVSNGSAGTEAAFKTAWNLGDDVTVIATGGPGLGGNDAVSLFDSANNFITGFNYKTAAVTVGAITIQPFARPAAATPLGGHAGPSAGATFGDAVSAVWDGVSTASPVYVPAAIGSLNVRSQSGSITSIGSPGTNGLFTVDYIPPTPAAITPDTTVVPAGELRMRKISSMSLFGSEISSYDSASKRMFITSNLGLQIVDASNPFSPQLLSIVDFRIPAIGLNSTDVTSVDVFNGKVAVAVPNATKDLPGHVVFLNAADGSFISKVQVGVLPDNLTFTPDGTKVLTADEGEMLVGGTDPAAGSVTIIDLADINAPVANVVGFASFDASKAALKASGVRIFEASPGVLKNPSIDFEPEYVAVSPDSTKAMVTLQEANAVALLDIASATFTSIVPLGEKDYSTLLADFSDQDGGINLATGKPVSGLYMPDAIASFSANGQTYYVTANEGDDRNDFLTETTTVSNAGYVLDPIVFPNALDLKATTSLGRLVVSNAPGLRGDTDNDGDIDRILSYGGRSISILDSTGTRIWDSGDVLDQKLAALGSPFFDDGRSDAKSIEPEGVTIGEIDGRTYAFVALERARSVAAFDVTNPAAPTYAGLAATATDANPEGITFISKAESPIGQPMIAVTNETSNTLTFYSVSPYTLQLLHLADAEAGLLASETAPNLAALVDAFDGTYPNTLILAGGDNYIPGPFAAAGTDAAVSGIETPAFSGNWVGGAHTRGNNPFAADIEIHNRIGVEASTVGNHEFDFGTNAFSDAINDTTFPYLTSNLNFSGDSGISSRYQETVGVGGLEEASSLPKKIVPSCVVTKGGQKIGLVGVTTQILEGISSTGGVEVKGFTGDGLEANDMALLASQVQPVINDLLGQGVNKIVLMAHLQQITFEQQLAPLLTGVDIVLAAGSNTRLGDSNDVAVAFPGHAADFADNYPIYTAGADGFPAVIVNTDNEFTYLGRLVADFDANGVLIVPNLTANTAVNGAYAATAANAAAAWGVAEVDLPTSAAFAPGTKGALVKQITEAVKGVISAKDGSIRGYTDVYLEGERNFVRNQETNLGDISADSMIFVGQAALPSATHMVAMKNAGGIRAAIGAVDVVSGAKLPPIANPAASKPAGAISQLDIENSMRFNNGLMLCDTTPAGLKAILEHGVFSLGNQGRFPQIGGIRFSFDPAATPGSRVQSIVLTDGNDNITARVVSGGLVRSDAPATITLVTLNFLANGGDSYPFKANADNFRFLLNDGTLSAAVDEAENFTAAGVVPANLLGEQLALSNYLQDRYATPATAYDIAETAPALDTRIQSRSVRADNVLDGPATFAAWLASNGYTSSGLNADTDLDGTIDLVEYYFNQSPNSGADNGNFLQLMNNAGKAELRFTMNNRSTYAGYLKVSSDLEFWVDALDGVDYTLDGAVTNGDETAFTYALPGSGPSAPGTSATYSSPNSSDPVGATLGGVRVVNEGLVGVGRISGNSLDQFGETQGAASGLFITDWAWNGNQFTGTFNVLPDRGYNSGAIFSNYAARLHEVDFTFSPYYGTAPVAQGQIVPTYASSTKFTYQDGATVKFTTGLDVTGTGSLFGESVGVATAANGPGGAQESLLSFDAEAVYLFKDGSGYVSDEYGTYIARFDSSKRITGITQLPESARPHNPVGTSNFSSTATPANGRRQNQGLEGMSVTPDGSRLFAVMQSALVQDTDGTNQQTRNNTRLFVYDILGAKRENPVLVGQYVVKLPQFHSTGSGAAVNRTAAQSEIIALNATSFLMLPRDGNGLGTGSTTPIVFKSVQVVDFASATNILRTHRAEGAAVSPAGVLAPGVVAAASAEIINMLDPADLAKFGLNKNTAPADTNTLNEKMEGMALVSDVSTPQPNDFFLFIANDNDFQSSDVKMVDAAGNLVSYGDGRLNAGITNDAMFYAYRVTIDRSGKRFFRVDIE